MSIEVNVDEANEKIHITLDMCEPAVTTSKKSILIASSRGHARTKARYKGEQVAVNVNVYLPNKN